MTSSSRARCRTGSCSPVAAGRRRIGALVGVLALQGDFEAHGARAARARRRACARCASPRDLDGLDGARAPRRRVDDDDARDRARGAARAAARGLRRGVPVLGTCAGHDHARPRPPRACSTCAASATRSAARCTASRATSTLAGFDEPFHGVFIRAPWVAEHGRRVEVLGAVDGHPVAVAPGGVLAVAFHPELIGERPPAPRLLDQL